MSTHGLGRFSRPSPVLIGVIQDEADLLFAPLLIPASCIVFPSIVLIVNSVQYNFVICFKLYLPTYWLSFEYPARLKLFTFSMR
jgi:hypothetical protein